MDKVKEHADSIRAQNAEIAQQNKASEVELKVLRKSLEAKQKELAGTMEEGLVAQIQNAINSLKQQIAQQETMKRTLIVAIGPTKFSKREDADTYIEQVRQEATRAKARAEAKAVAAKKN